MKMFTLRLKPKTVFGLIMILTGAVVIAITFFSNHVEGSKQASSAVMIETNEKREEYLKSLGWEFKTEFEEKSVNIPQEFNDTYTKYNELQKKQGFSLDDYKGKSITVYTYQITNYPGYENRDCVFANLLVCDGMLIGGDVCSTSLSDGFMQGLEKQ